MSTDRKSFMNSLTIMAKTFSLNGVMVGHGGYSEVARQHAERRANWQGSRAKWRGR